MSERSMSEELALTRAKRSGNRAVSTKLMNEADDYCNRINWIRHA